MAMERWRPFGWGLRRWLPVRTIDEEMDEMLDRFERVFGMPMRRALVETRGWGPLVEMVDKEDEILLKVELPGVKKGDIRVSVTGDVLTLEGERKQEAEVKEEDYYCCERSYGKFYREITLPAGINREKISSEYKDGVLEIHMPKAEEAKPKEIEIKVK